jgi:hypothetical protein
MNILEEANALNEAGKFDEAFELYDRILAQNPEHPAVLAAIATIMLRGGKQNGVVVSLLKQALAKTGPRADILCNLGVAYKNEGLREKAVECFEKSIKASPTVGGLTGYGSLFVERGEPEKAIESFEKAIKIDPSIAMTRWNLALALLENGSWDRAWDEHEWGMKAGGMRVDRGPLYDKPQWDGKSPGKVVLWGEQGIGDEIMFASMIPDVMKTNEVILDCHPRLKTLFENSFGVKCYGTRKEEGPDWVKKEDYQWQCAMGSLGKYFRRSREAFPGNPYLKAEALPKTTYRVGISWTGGKKATRVAKRTVPLSWWDSILSNHGIEFVSLQYTDCEKEIAELEASTPHKVRQFTEAKAEDYNEAAKLVASCDLVITVCTSVLHLAGALGVPCWVMVPFHPDWRAGKSGGMPWYRSVRQYRQPTSDMEGWVSVVQRIGLDLEDRMRKAA